MDRKEKLRQRRERDRAAETGMLGERVSDSAREEPTQ